MSTTHATSKCRRRPALVRSVRTASGCRQTFVAILQPARHRATDGRAGRQMALCLLRQRRLAETRHHVHAHGHGKAFRSDLHGGHEGALGGPAFRLSVENQIRYLRPRLRSGGLSVGQFIQQQATGADAAAMGRGAVRVHRVPWRVPGSRSWHAQSRPANPRAAGSRRAS